MEKCIVCDELTNNLINSKCENCLNLAKCVFCGVKTNNMISFKCERCLTLKKCGNCGVIYKSKHSKCMTIFKRCRICKDLYIGKEDKCSQCENEKIKCSECGNFYSSNYIILHYNSHQKRESKCSKCGLIKEEKDFKIGTNICKSCINEDNKKKIKCPVCGKNFSKSYLWFHKKKH